MSRELAVGIDGCPGGWVAVAVSEDRLEDAVAFADIQSLAGAWPSAAAFAIDIPLSFPSPSSYPRGTELQARRFLGGAAGSLFLTPPREVLRAPTYAQALARARSSVGKGISRQSYGLRAKIFELERFLESTADKRFYEVHPEVSFRVLGEMVGASISASKKTWNGLQERLEALRLAGFAVPAGPIEALGRTGIDDVVDAAVAAWTAQRIRLGEARGFFGDERAVEERAPDGKRGVIWA